jgi:hypothetical protein
MNILPLFSINPDETLRNLDRIMVSKEDSRKKPQKEFQVDFQEELIDIICEKFFPKEEAFFPTIELVRQLSSHSVVFQFNVVRERKQDGGYIQYPRQAILFTLNLYPESQCLQLSKIYEYPNLLNFLLKKVRKKISEAKKELVDHNLIPADYDSQHKITVSSYHIFHNIYVDPESQKASLYLGHAGSFCLDHGDSTSSIIKELLVESDELVLTRIEQDGLVWFQLPES